jgi:hypothetical protein
MTLDDCPATSSTPGIARVRLPSSTDLAFPNPASGCRHRSIDRLAAGPRLACLPDPTVPKPPQPYFIKGTISASNFFNPQTHPSAISLPQVSTFSTSRCIISLPPHNKPDTANTVYCILKRCFSMTQPLGLSHNQPASNERQNCVPRK